MHHATERRRFDRRYVSHDLAVEIASGFLDPVRGAVYNISRGGVLLQLSALPGGATDTAHCVVRFRGMPHSARVRPSVSRGRILRRNVTGAGVHLAIEFSEPLVSLR